MTKGRLQGEIKQTRPFRSGAEEAYLNLVRTTDVLTREIAGFLKPYGLSEAQYNVLRILRGAGDEGHTCSEVGQRLITRDPDVTRLLDRLERRDLIARSRDNRDRRVVTIRITRAGLDLLDELDGPMAAATDGLLAHMAPGQLEALVALLEAARRA
ncbi:MAG: MarR family winged helix-turn-helix transcriptional regulator [Vicinamibacterales bacterium]